ncbi:MAG: hypothetical protein KDA37_15905 [Planctomycetales bacterium]|nr:hypothetical protein [Planctomycetales bacterium]
MKETMCRSLLLVQLMAAAVDAGSQAEAKPTSGDPPPVTLMGLLQDWLYPDAEFRGGQMSDGGVPHVASIKSSALQLTKDPVEQVLAHYCKKLGVDSAGKQLQERAGERGTGDDSVLVQDASGQQPGSLYVIVVNRPAGAMTLVICLDSQSKHTRIAWSDYRRLTP